MPASPRVGLPERRAARRLFERSGRTFDEADVVHGEARTRLLERLTLFSLQPTCVLDIGAATGKASVELAARFPHATVISMDLSPTMVRQARDRCAHTQSVTPIIADAERLPLPEASVDLIFANLVLPWCDPQLFFGEAARVLRSGGLLMFTTVGPDTLREIRWAWSEVDEAIHVHGFIDMHDIGDLAARAGLAEPVMDVDRLRVTYRGARALIGDLRACGATNVAFGRRASLTGPRRWQAFIDRLRAAGVEGILPITVELVFGQAWGGALTRSGQDLPGTAGISLQEMTRILRGRG